MFYGNSLYNLLRPNELSSSVIHEDTAINGPSREHKIPSVIPVTVESLESTTESTTVSDTTPTTVTTNTDTTVTTTIHSKQIESTPLPQRLTRPDWITILASIPGKYLTFRKITLQDNLNFYFPEEGVMSQAEYIVKYEVDIIHTFFETIKYIKPRTKPCYIIDIGTNGGFYTILGRTLGCYVLGVDAQPYCIHKLNSAIHMNGYGSDNSVTVKLGIITEQNKQFIDVGNNKCSGTWSINDADWINKESKTIIPVETYTLSTILEQWLHSGIFSDSDSDSQLLVSSNYILPKPLINIMKMDIEGNEIIGLLSILNLIKKRLIEHYILDLVPERLEFLHHFNDTKQVFQTFYTSGYFCSINGNLDMNLDMIYRRLDIQYKKEWEIGVSSTWRCSLPLSS